MKRTHHCNELRAEHAGQTVTLTGWVHSRRDLGGLLFIDLRDREGRTQTLFDPADLAKDVFEVATHLHSESVIEITGKVRVRPAGTNNDKIPTGQVEVLVQETRHSRVRAVQRDLHARAAARRRGGRGGRACVVVEERPRGGRHMGGGMLSLHSHATLQQTRDGREERGRRQRHGEELER
jgi:hypothetical protein